jgi:PKD repeat protein
MKFLSLFGFVSALVLSIVQQSFGQCQASFSWSASGSAVTFNSVTGGMNPSATFYSWTFGDGSTGSGANPVHSYNTPGPFLVCLVASDSNCIWTYCDTIILFNNNPCTNFSASYTYSGTGNSISYSSAVQGGTAPYSYSWSFGDGNTSLAANPVHTYNSSGWYAVTLLVVDVNGCTYSYVDSVGISTTNPCNGFGVSANAFTDTTATVQGLVYFDGYASGGVAPYNFVWDYGDNTLATGQYTNHTYNNPNQWYNYCVTATDANGCTASYCNSVNANNPCADSSLYASFSFQNLNGAVNFVSSTGQTVSNYFWNFGDGSTSTQANPSHQYAASGSYTVYLYVNFVGGCSRSSVQTITIGNANPCNNFGASYSYSSNGQLASFNSTVVGGTPPYVYNWNFGDGGSSTLANPSYTYPNTNSIMYYGAYLVVTDINGCMYTSYDTVVINGGTPCNLNEVTLEINFDNYAYETSWDLRDAQGTIVANGAGYTPNQNGSTLTQTFCLPTACYVFNIYDSYGDGLCCLYGQGDYSLTDAAGTILAAGAAFGYTDTKTICLGGASNPCSNFSTFFSATTNASSVTFTTPGQGLQYVWDFGDNTVGSGSNPIHTYTSVPSSGMYTVCVTAYDSSGCVATFCDTVVVSAPPCTNNQVTLALNFDNFAYETSWTITDINNVVLYSGNGYTYADNGTTQYLNFCMPVGCYDFNIYDSYGDGICCGWGQGSYVLTDASNTILASGGSFTHAESSNWCVGGASNPCGNFNTSFSYTGTSNGGVNFTSNSPTASSYVWNFGDGSTSFQINPSVSYTNNGSYTVCLTVTDSSNCSAFYCQNVLVASLNNNQVPCNGLSVDMNITQDSINPFNLWMQPIINNAANNAFFYYVWDFGDNTGAFSGSPTHQYNNFGSYVVCLTAFDSVNNCIASFCDTITLDSAGNFSRNIQYKDTKPGFLVNTSTPIINYYSAISPVLNTQFELEVYPNPTAENIHVSLTTAEAGEGLVSILNVAGQVVFSEILACPSGSCNQSYDLKQLPSGVYLLKWSSDVGQQSRKFIKQ